MFLLLLPVSLGAGSVTEEMLVQEGEKLIGEMNLQEMQEAMPGLDVSGLLRLALRGESAVSAESVWASLKSSLIPDVKEYLSGVVRLIGFALLCAALSLFRESFGGADMGRLCEILLCAAALLLPLQSLAALFSLTQSTLASVSAAVSSVTPTLCALLVAQGGTKTAIFGEELSLLLTDALVQGTETLLFPVLKVAAAASAMSVLIPELKCDRLKKLPLSFVKWSCGIGFAAFLGMLTVRGMTAARYDGVTLRAAKYAVEKLVPVVGGVFKDTTDALLGSLSLLSGALGTVGMLGILSVLLAPAVRVLCSLLLYRLCCAVMEPFSVKLLCDAMEQLCEMLLVLFLLLVTVGAMDVVFLASLVRMGGDLL